MKSRLFYTGSNTNHSATILLTQVGGKHGRWDVTAAGDPLFSPNEGYILFLIPDQRQELPNTSGMPRYTATGVWSGKVRVMDGKVQFAGRAYPDLHSYDNMDVSMFMQKLKDTISNPSPNKQLPIHPKPPTHQPKRVGHAAFAIRWNH